MTPPPRPRSRPMALLRTLHVYLTMLGLLPIAFIAFTGFMLNHPGWFERDGGPAVAEADGTLPADLLAEPARGPIVAWLRGRFDLRGADDNFELDENEIRVVFRRPGGQADVVIDRASGRAEVAAESRGLVGQLEDLHTGAEAGGVWKLLIDVTAGLLVFAAVSGMAIWLVLPRRRLVGAIALAAAAATWLAVYLLAVP